MTESALLTVPASQTEIMIRNLAAAGFSEEDIHDEIAGYGCAQTFARLLGYEQAGGVLPERQDESEFQGR